MAKHLGAYSSLHGPAGKILTDYAEQNIPQLWNRIPERITDVRNTGKEYVGTIFGYTTADPFTYVENKLFFFTPHVTSLASPLLSINGLPLVPIIFPAPLPPPGGGGGPPVSPSSLPAGTLKPEGDYLLWYRDGAFELLLNLRTIGDDLLAAERIIQLLADDQDIAAYQGAADLIATGGYSTWSDAGGKFWKRTGTGDPTLTTPTFWKRQAFDGYWYQAVTKRTVFGEEIGITGDTNDLADNYAPQINDVFEWMNLRGGGRLILPPGQIRCNGNIIIKADGVRLEGTAAGLTSTGGTTLLMASNSSIIIGGNVATGGTINQQIHLANLGLQQEAGSAAFLVTSGAVRGLHFQDIHLRGVYGFHNAGNILPLAGATPNVTSGFTYRNITGTFDVTSSHFLRCNNVGNFTMTNVAIDGPTPVTADSSAIYMPTGAVTRPDACNITSCRFTGFDRAIRIDNGISNLMVTNCVFDRCKTNAVLLAPDTTISGVRFNNCSFIAQSPPTANQIGMHLHDGTTAGTIRRLSVTNSQFLRWGRNAISMADPNRNIIITGNQFEDNSSTDVAQPVIHIATEIDHVTVSNNQIYKETSTLAEPSYAIQIASTKPHINVVNNQINLNSVGVAAINNPNRGPAHTRRVHNNTGQIFEGQIVTLGPWTQENIVANTTGIMEVAGTLGLATLVLSRRGKAVAIAARSSVNSTGPASSLSFNVIKNGVNFGMTAIIGAGPTAECFDEDIDGNDFAIGDQLGIRYNAGAAFAPSGSADWAVYITVYYD